MFVFEFHYQAHEAVVITDNLHICLSDISNLDD